MRDDNHTLSTVGGRIWKVAVGMAVVCCVDAMPALGGDSPIKLGGTWRFQLDRQNTGIDERWFERSLTEHVVLPGTLPGQGIGDDISATTHWTGDILDSSWFVRPEYEAYRRPGNVKVPYWLQPEKYYAGAAWYQREFEIPQKWAKKRIVLLLERPHWETRVWCDGFSIGSNNSLSTPHVYDLGTTLSPGRHLLTVRVDNSLVVDIGINSHSITDHTQGNWNGIVGRVELMAGPPVWIQDLQVYADAAKRSIAVHGMIGNMTGLAGKGIVKLAVGGASTLALADWTPEGGMFSADLRLGDGAQMWDEFNPVLHTLTAVLDDGSDSISVRFGLRTIATSGTQFVLNGRKIFLRGTLECAVFPKTGHPPTDLESWKRVVGIAKAHGLNLFRFHSWCPPEAAFIAADELGFYLHVEAGSWANQSTTLGDGKPVDRWVYDETDRILRAYGNHPSFLFMLYGNEPGGQNHQAYLAKWVSHYTAVDTRRLFAGAAGWPQIPENQFHVTHHPRIQGWGEGLKSRINARPPETHTNYRAYIQQRTVPVISHEIGQWCVYPNFDESRKYTGYLKPKNFDIFRDGLIAHHMGQQAHDFLIASGKLQTLCYKEEIESALRTPGMGGFELLDLHDFPGQGTALVGILDPFWDSKGYVKPDEFKRFCNSTVPLARMSKRVFATSDTLEAEVEVAHFGPLPLKNAVALWKLVNSSGRVVARGALPAHSIPVDNGVQLGTVRVKLHGIPAPSRYRLVVGLRGTGFENDWDVWVYPEVLPAQTAKGVTLAHSLSDSVLSVLNSGGNVLLMIPPAEVRGDQHGAVALGFSSIFWNTAWTTRQAPHTLGILCEPKHPALTEFPTESHSNYQWWYLVSRAAAMILDGLPPTLRPIVQVIDDWVTNRKLGLVFEASVGKGRVLVTSIDLENGCETGVVARQFRFSLLRYMESKHFKPSALVTVDQLRGLIAGRPVVGQ